MTILNDREIIIVQYNIFEHWAKLVPKGNWVCILVDNDKARNYTSKMINSDVCYVCTIGDHCELNHDLIDEEIAYRQVIEENKYLPKHLIMTSCHHDFSEGMWFGIFAANNDEVKIDKVVILDMTEGEEIHRITTLIKEFQTSN